MPVSKMASRSARGVLALSSAARFGNTPGYSTGSRAASSGCATYWANCLSWSGGWVFQKSLLPSAMIDLVDQRVAQP